MVASRLELLDDGPNNPEVIAQRHIGDVLHQNSPRLDRQSDLHEGAPQLAAVIVSVTPAVRDQTADLAAPGAAEGLTGRPSTNEIDAQRAEQFDQRGHRRR